MANSAIRLAFKRLFNFETRRKASRVFEVLKTVKPEALEVHIRDHSLWSNVSVIEPTAAPMQRRGDQWVEIEELNDLENHFTVKFCRRLGRTPAAYKDHDVKRAAQEIAAYLTNTTAPLFSPE